MIWSSTFSNTYKRRHIDLILIATLVTLVGLLWGLWSPFSSQDGPIHLYSAFVYKALNEGSYPTINHIYQLTPGITPQWLFTQIMGLCLELAGPAYAETLLVSLYLIASTISWSIAFANSARNRAAACLVGPLLFCQPLHLGFYAFTLGLPLFILSVAIWGRRDSNYRTQKLGALFFITTALHPATGGLTIATIGLAELFITTITLYRGRAVAFRTLHSATRPLLLLALASILSLLLVGLHLHDTHGTAAALRWPDPRARIADIMLGSAVLNSSPFSIIGGAMFSGAVFVPFYLALRSKAIFNARSIALILGCLTLTATVPDELGGGGYLGVRLNVIFFICMVFALSQFEMSKTLERTTIILGALIASSLLFVHQRHLATLDALDLVSLERLSSRIPEHSTVMPIIVGDWVSNNSAKHSIRPDLHVYGRVAINRDIALLQNYQANLAYFPIAFKTSTNPYSQGLIAGAIEWGLPTIYARTNDGRCLMDYVLIFDGPSEFVDRLTSLRDITPFSHDPSRWRLLHCEDGDLSGSRNS